MKRKQFTSVLFSFILCLFASNVSAIEPQHQVAGSYGGTRLYAHDSVVISPSAKINLYSQTTTGLSTDSSNSLRKDTLCRSVVNTSDNDYFVPWRSALATGVGQINEWQKFITAAGTGTIPGVTVGSCCYPRINPNKPCSVTYHLGKRKAGALPSDNPTGDEESAEIEHYGAEGDISYDVVGYNRKQTWVCQGGEWIYTADEGGCFQNGKCNTYDPVTNPTGLNGASVNAIPSSNRDTLMCNGVVPTSVSGSKFPQPDSLASAPPYGTAGWTWRCPGQNGGTSENCHADYAGGPMNAVCGYAGWRTYSTAPIDPNLCYVGTASTVSGPTTDNKWLWTCAGVNGGKSASCTAYYPTPAKASCGSYASGGRPYGLLSFETVNGYPHPSYLCSSSTLNGSISGNGTTAAPWVWQCYNADSKTTVNCTNVYTKPGKCGSANGTAVPSAPNISANMCSQGRWYNKATTSPSSNSVIYDATAKKWTWACLGHNLTTGALSNDLCSASACAACSGTGSETITKRVYGTYGSCSFTANQATLNYRQNYMLQADSTDVNASYRFDYTGEGTFTAPTNVAEGYCSPCYKKATALSAGTITLNACIPEAPREFSATLSIQ